MYLRSVILSLVVFAAVGGLLGQTTADGAAGAARFTGATAPRAEIVRIPYRAQEEFLEGLLPSRNGDVVVNVRLLFNGLSRDDRGSVCTYQSSGSTTRYGATQYRESSTASLCHEVHGVSGMVVLGLGKVARPRGVHLIYMACRSGYSKRQRVVGSATMGWGLLFAHGNKCFVQDGPDQQVFPSKKRHGVWEVDIAARSALGGKVHLAKFHIIEVRLARFVAGKSLKGITGAPR